MSGTLEASCPVCGNSITGSVDNIKNHVLLCGKKKAKPKGKLVVPVATNRVVPPLPFELCFARPIVSQNLYKSKSWWVYAKEAKAWRELMAEVATPLIGVQFSYSRWSLVRHYVKPQRRFDYGNLVGGTKPIPDALVKCGIIKDDAEKYFKCEYDQVEATRNRTVLTLIEAKL